jgi:hypothetical protein
MKKIAMSNIDFIRKWDTYDEDRVVLVLDGEFMAELDESSEEIILYSGQTISFANLEKYSVWVNSVEDIELNTHIPEFIKDVKKSTNFITKLCYGVGCMFITNGYNEFIYSEELETFNDLECIFEKFEQNLQLVEMQTIEECHN